MNDSAELPETVPSKISLQQDLDTRQNAVIRDLDELNQRIETLIAVWTKKRESTAEAA